MIGLQRHHARLRLARLPARSGRLDAVVGRIADHMCQRVLDQFQDLAVQFRLRALHIEIDLLARFDR